MINDSLKAIQEKIDKTKEEISLMIFSKVNKRKANKKLATFKALKKFVTERIIVSEGTEVKATVLYASYVTWATAQKVAPVSGHLFTHLVVNYLETRNKHPDSKICLGIKVIE